MDVTVAVLADYANVTREGKVNILGIFDIIYTKHFPVILPTMQLVMKFEAPRTEVEMVKNVVVKLLDQDGNQILEIGGPFKLEKLNNNPITIQSNHFLILNNLRFDKAGDYVFSVLVNGEKKRSVPLKVIKLDS